MLISCPTVNMKRSETFFSIQWFRRQSIDCVIPRSAQQLVSKTLPRR
jgi:hypothetical protein